ncbi:uncharacterized protein LY89DRAFT_327913 [Mollisia scopiformis]|uniref:Uncharacterized protein n=1 Tax=Mollisia scopiformis TaxID=149040 RepID=A0A132BAH7_MOLSC|nr:uncharacterized protein LY89DRAFT_327913 [Mollisia scopiformis]KUJ08864.1 hypothetical protein LY89DRAFT_327913 [Mollisia scopiformis]
MLTNGKEVLGRKQDAGSSLLLLPPSPIFLYLTRYLSGGFRHSAQMQARTRGGTGTSRETIPSLFICEEWKTDHLSGMSTPYFPINQTTRYKI